MSLTISLELKNAHELCAITGYPAKYRDPSTGLPYCNSYAYKEIQRLKRGDYKWSKLVGAYVGQGTYAARGVPPRFLNAKPAAQPTAATSQSSGK
jgi:vacuolar protein sorting-associated protein 72